MQTFFIITGFCSSFKVGFKDFLWKNIKTLLIPSILLFLFSEYYKMIVFQADNHPFVLLLDWLTTGGPWFIITMFWAKIIYYGIYKLSVKYQIALMGLLYFSGLVLPHFHVINYQWHQHVFLMIADLYVGTWCKTHVDVMERYLKPVAYFGALSIVLQNFIAQLGGIYTVPEHDFGIGVTIWNFPVHIANALSGTAFIFYISKRIGENKFLKTMGTGTLIVYLWNGIVYRSVVKAFLWAYRPDDLLLCSLFHIVTLGLCYLSFYFIIKLIYQHKSLNWIVGKW